MYKISDRDIAVGAAIPWDCFDEQGVLLLRKGAEIQSQTQVSGLLARGLYTSHAPALPTRASGTKRESSVALLGDLQLRLRGLFAGVMEQQPLPGFPERVLHLAQDLQALCASGTDAALGALHLGTEQRYTVTHPLHVGILCETIAIKKGIPYEDRSRILAAALTANIAMLNLQERLQKQHSPLSVEQRIEIGLHPVRAEDLLRSLGVTDELWLSAVAHHHERTDGSGYPYALENGAQSLAARLIALSDIYAAKVSARAYRGQLPARDALRDLFLRRGNGLDPELAQLFIKELGVYPPGSFVKLANGEVAVVTHRGEQMKPRVQTVLGPLGAPMEHPVKRDTAEPAFAVVSPCARPKLIRASLPDLWG